MKKLFLFWVVFLLLLSRIESTEYMPTILVRTKIWASYTYMLMGDYNTWKDDENKRMIRLGWDPLPSFHYGIVGGIEASWFFMDIWGFGVGVEVLTGRGIDYSDEYYEKRTDYKKRNIITYKHSAKTVPLFGTLYLLPNFFGLSWRIGIGPGLYYAWASFYRNETKRKDYTNGDYVHEHSFMDSKLTALGVGAHMVVRVEKELPASFFIFVEIKGRRAKLSNFEGRREMHYNYTTPDSTFEEEHMDDVELKYGKKKTGEIYFGPVFAGEWVNYDIIREGVVDFSGVGVSFGITYQF